MDAVVLVLHAVGPLCTVERRGVQVKPLSGEEERATRLWRANLSLRQDVSLDDGGSKRRPAWVCEPLPVVRLWTPPARKKEKMPRVLCTSES